MRNVRDNMMKEIFDKTMVIEDYVRSIWQKGNYLPNNNEIKYACNQLCMVVKNTAKDAFKGKEDLYERFCKECEEIKERFQKLNPESPIDASCGVYQVNYYLHDEAYDLISEALGLYVPKCDDYEY